MSGINTPTGGNERSRPERETLIKEKGNELSETLDIPQELKDYRELWKEKIERVDETIKEKIIQVAEKIPVKVEKDEDGSRLIEFKLGTKTRTILDPKLNTHSDNKYKINPKDDSITNIDQDYVMLGSIRGDSMAGRANETLKKYVKEKKGEGLHIPTIEEMKRFLRELGKETGLSAEEDQIAMLMYLTGMDGTYWLSMGDYNNSKIKNSRSKLLCDKYLHGFAYSNRIYEFANLCMIACK